MRIVSLGMDLIECRRVGEIVERHGERFLQRILTESERGYIGGKAHPMPHIAGRFAAKEAVLKVLGTGWRGPISWTDVEVVNDADGQPRVRLHGPCVEIAARRGIAEVLVTITHTPHYAAASAIGVARE